MFDSVHPVSISNRAAEEVKKIMATKSIPEGYGLRVGVKGGGCGVTLIIGFDRQKSGDLSYEADGITILVDKKHMLYVMGKQIDFLESADARGFMFLDPEQKQV
jgi:iron-sulfur cluster assembly protein